MCTPLSHRAFSHVGCPGSLVASFANTGLFDNGTLADLSQQSERSSPFVLCFRLGVIVLAAKSRAGTPPLAETSRARVWVVADYLRDSG